VQVWRRSSPEPAPDERLLRDLVIMVMRTDAKLDRVPRTLGEDDGEEEMDA
jgi:hypothetical protein